MLLWTFYLYLLFLSLTKKGADPSKPKCRKAKEIRKERRSTKASVSSGDFRRKIVIPNDLNTLGDELP